VVISSAYGTLRDIVSVAHNINAPDLDGPVNNFAAAAQGGAGNTTPTINITSAVGDLVIDMVCSNVGSPQTFTEGGGQTNLVEQEVSGGNFKAASSSEAGAASVTMSWTLGTSDDWGICGFSVPATGTVANNDTRITQQGIHALTQKSVQFDPDVRVTQFGIHVVVQQTAAPTGGGPFLHYARLRGA
jgi:hypothetical protein